MPSPLHEAAGVARHDLGKAIALNARWLPPNASTAERVEALREDLLFTRQSRAGVEGAVALWARLRPPLASLAEDPELQAVDAAIALIARHSAALQSGEIDAAALDVLSAAARAVSEALARLADRLKEG